jgi:glycosyltransferase involved in cell wall biosynthesis
VESYRAARPVRPRVRYLSEAGDSGYAVAARRLMIGLTRIGCPIAHTPLGWCSEHPLFPSCRTAEVQPTIPHPRGAEPEVVIVHATPEFLPAVEHLVPPGVPLVLHTDWEFERLPADWPGLINRADAVIVPTRWNAETFADGGVRIPVLVVPHAHAEGIEPARTDWLETICPAEDLMLHSIATWHPRKRPDLTLQAYARAFGPTDATTMVLRTSGQADWVTPGSSRPGHRHLQTSWLIANLMHRHAPAPRLNVITETLSFEQIAGLHHRSGCWVSLPHAEGWDVGCFDAAVAGCPVVTTAYGAPLEYLDPETSHMVPAKLVDSDFHRGARWAVPDLDAAVDLLRLVYADPEGAMARAAAQAERLRVKYEAATVAAGLVDQLHALGLVAAQ